MRPKKYAKPQNQTWSRDAMRQSYSVGRLGSIGEISRSEIVGTIHHTSMGMSNQRGLKLNRRLLSRRRAAMRRLKAMVLGFVDLTMTNAFMLLGSGASALTADIW